VELSTGIPHSPAGQSIVERKHQSLKRILEQQKDGHEIDPPVIRLSKALFTLNFLNCSFEEPDPPVLRHFANNTRAKLRERHEILNKDPDTLQTCGPYPLI
ncbi:IGEB protein, partial [Dyaphorophyia castanea]|nr:IGEB protein [Platysteira castanea]